MEVLLHRRPLRLLLLLTALGAALAAAGPTAARGEEPEMVVQLGPSALVTSLAFSHDGGLLASGGTDRVIRLWETASGRLLATLNMPPPAERGVVFAPGGRLIAINSGREVFLWQWAEATVNSIPLGGVGDSLAFSHDGRLLVTGSLDGSWEVWEVATAARVRRVVTPSRVHALAVSRDGRLLCTGGMDGSVTLWDFASGELRSNLYSHDRPVSLVNFSADDGTLTSHGGSTIKKWDLRRRLPAGTVKSAADLSNLVAVSADGLVAASATRALVSLDHSIRIVDAATGQVRRTLKGHEQPVTALAFSPAGPLIASGSWDTKVKLWSWDTGDQMAPHLGEVNVKGVSAIAAAPGGRLLASAGSGDTVRLWDLDSGEFSNALGKQSDRVYSVAFAPDNRTLATGGGDNRVRLWDVETGDSQELPGFVAGDYGFSQRVSFASGAGHLIYGGADEKVRVWNADAKRVEAEWEMPGPVDSVALAPDGGLALVGSGDTLYFWDRRAGGPAPVSKRRPRTPVSLSADGKVAASVGESGAVEFRAADTRADAGRAEVSSAAVALAPSPDGTLWAVGCENGTIALWDISTRSLLPARTGHASAVTSLAFLRGGKVLASGSEDGTIKFWGVAERRLLTSLQPLAENDWLTFTPEGFFDGTRRSWGMIPFRFPSQPTRLYEPEQFFNVFFQPGLLADVVREVRPVSDILRAAKGGRAGADIAHYRDSKLPVVRIVEPRPSAAVAGRTARVEVEATDEGSGVQDCRVFRNNSLAYYRPGPAPGGGAAKRFSAEIKLTEGVNEISAYCFNRDGLKSKDDTAHVRAEVGGRRRGAAYVIAVGVNVYSNPDYRLRYAAPDAEDFGAEAGRRLKELGVYSAVEVITLRDEQAVGANILAALGRLGRVAGAPPPAPPPPVAEMLERIRPAEPEDTVIIFFSGHGTAQGDRFYLLPHDLGYTGRRTELDERGLATILAHGISDLRLEEALRGVDAGTILLVIDACNSGQALEAEEKRRGPLNSKGLAQLAYEKGMYVLTASQGYQAAWEMSELGHGLLTYALVVEGLKLRRAQRGAGAKPIGLKDWLDYATRRVPQMQLSKMRECRDPIRVCAAVVEGEESIRDVEARTLQRPRLFYRRERAGQEIAVAGPQTVPR